MVGWHSRQVKCLLTAAIRLSGTLLSLPLEPGASPRTPQTKPDVGCNSGLMD